MSNARLIPSAVRVGAAVALLAAACGGTNDIKSGETFLKALPDEQTLTVAVVGQETSGLTMAETGVAYDQQALVGQLADMDILSKAVAWSINVHARKLLAEIKFVTQLPPRVAMVESGSISVGDKTFAYNARAVWGPYQDKLKNLEFSLLIWRGIDPKDNRTTFIYMVQGRTIGAGDGAWKTLVEGAAKPVEEHGGNRMGLCKVDFDAWKTLDATSLLVGQVAFYYEIRKDGHSGVALVGTGVCGDLTCSTTANPTYLYGRSVEGYALLNFTTAKDVIDTTTAPEYLQVATAWTIKGNGRSDVTVSKGDLGDAGSATMIECWGILLRQTYFRLYTEGVTPSIDVTSGSESNCFRTEPIPMVDVDYEAIANAF